MREYLSVSGETVTESEISRSKFITHLTAVENVDEGLKYLAAIRKKYSDATHNCYAVIGSPESNEFKFGDDGEPSGTAGQPILNALVKNGLYCVCAVVTRYFGGIKLGAGGLVQAYSGAASGAVRASEITRYKYSVVYVAELAYPAYGAVANFLAESGAVVTDVEYSDGVKVTFAVPEENAAATEKKLAELTSGEARYAIKDKKYISYKR
ncbi:MAG: YigZ family protein [Firmicutes bacterium]|uniref:YigZ family protein n=1 Tax=Candidatus Stercoripulliclostridium pullicola TaxID=2840953 RepID=A0A940IDD9_9FIRM|nr:YigZ family protein [Candidatus Stercoripulliclostridium pullicola]